MHSVFPNNSFSLLWLAHSCSIHTHSEKGWTKLRGSNRLFFFWPSELFFGHSFSFSYIQRRRRNWALEGKTFQPPRKTLHRGQVDSCKEWRKGIVGTEFSALSCALVFRFPKETFFLFQCTLRSGLLQRKGLTETLVSFSVYFLSFPTV